MKDWGWIQARERRGGGEDDDADQKEVNQYPKFREKEEGKEFKRE